MTGFSEYRGYSPLHDCEVARISMWDEHGGEFWMAVPCDDSRAYREARATAVEAIATAIQMGLQPGQVHLQ